MVLEAGHLRSGCQYGQFLDEDPLPGHGFIWWRDHISSYKGSNTTHKGSNLKMLLYDKVFTSKYHQGRDQKSNICIWGGDTSIQSIAMIQYRDFPAKDPLQSSLFIYSFFICLFNLFICFQSHSALQFFFLLMVILSKMLKYFSHLQVPL